MLRKASLICGILSSLLYAGMTVFIAMQWEGYSSASQTVSELSAIGAPTRSLWLAAWRALYRNGDRLRMGRLEIGRSQSLLAHCRGSDRRLWFPWPPLAVCADAPP